MKSPFGHVLQTNYVPTPEERNEIRSLVLEPEEQVRLLNEKISQLQAERDKLQRFIDDHRVLLSPARRLPRDIVAEIFLRCLPTHDLPEHHVSQAPLILTIISRSWREIALTTPRLWNGIRYAPPYARGFIDDELQALFHAHAKGLQLWLDRAKSVPLFISCIFYGDGYVPVKAWEQLYSMYVEIFEALSRYAAQWRSLYLKNVPHKCMLPFTALEPTDMPILASLAVREAPRLTSLPPNFLDSPTPKNPLFNVVHATALTSLHLIGVWTDLLDFPARWSCLTELIITTNYESGYNPAAAIPALAQRCHSLRIFTISHTLNADDVLAVRTPMQIWHSLSELTIKLTIRRFDGIQDLEEKSIHRVFERIFDNITAPALSKLHIHLPFTCPGGPYVMEKAPCFDFLVRSSCRIVSLDLSMCLTDKAIIDCLESECISGSIKDLYLDGLSAGWWILTDEGRAEQQPWHTAFTSDFFQSLSCRSLCPSLEKASLAVCPVDHIDEVVAFALARQSTMKYLRVIFQTKLPELVQTGGHDFADLSEEELAGRIIEEIWG